MLYAGLRMLLEAIDNDTDRLTTAVLTADADRHRKRQCLSRYDLTSSLRERTFDSQHEAESAVRMQENRVVSRQLT